MLLSSVVAALLVLVEGIACSVSHVDTENMFRERTRADWEDVWHKETHARCRHELLRHLFWACEKDIYRLAYDNPKPIYPFVDTERARTLVRSKRMSAGGITSECCHGQGCTWEEYAEYCPSHPRHYKP